MSIEVTLKNGNWICMRPKRYATQLEFSLQRYGLMMSGPILFGTPPLDVLRDNKGRVWVKNLLSENDILEKTISDPEWYITISKKRTHEYSAIRQKLSFIQTKLLPNTQSLEVIADVFSELGDMLNIFYAYIQLGLIDTEVVEKFSSTIYEQVPVRYASQYLNELLHSSYAHQFNSFGLKMNESKNISVNQENWLPVIQGDINFKPLQSTPDYIREHLPANQIGQFSSLAELTSVAYQLGQENLFLGKPLFDTVSFLLSKIGDIFIEKRLLLTKESLLNLNYQEILFKLENVENDFFQL